MEARKTVPVHIQVQTEMFQGGEKKEYFLEAKGQIVQIGGTLYIRYQEPQEESEEAVPVTVKILPDGSVQLIRAGEMRLRLKFDYQKRNDTFYKTPYGMIEVSTFTSNLRVSLRDQPISGSILVDYELYGGADKLGVYHLRLNFTA
ncbi:DUF1934 domain-containing protein [Vagococcus acidifermentans]|uniref:DUF1934 domain-containing protein n=1 Tax=Vagococcus acidifermentans TaxID=564710 RepID=A0A430ASA3_9ENTE|nr:DUF1934 domain-containing protein [Vagococcus acidifermentans]RSU10934.1 hypothetical protein CBF27_09585 [Vagococcus acidifermentans]